MKLVFASANGHKIAEVSKILGDSYELTSLAECGITEDIPENENSLEGNALAKARYVYRHTGLDCFADDTGLEVDALGGAPGVRSARYASSGSGHDSVANMRLLLSNLEGVSRRTARFRTVIALILGGKEYLFEGEVRGRIALEASGSGTFGYDPVFVPEAHESTFAAMTLEQKNSISHRARAVEAMRSAIEQGL